MVNQCESSPVSVLVLVLVLDSEQGLEPQTHVVFGGVGSDPVSRRLRQVSGRRRLAELGPGVGGLWDQLRLVMVQVLVLVQSWTGTARSVLWARGCGPRRVDQSGFGPEPVVLELV